jgi:membrane associated rhomboid family serine protease
MVIPLRDENPTQTVPFVTFIIILINVVVFLYELALGNNLDSFIKSYALFPGNFTQGIGSSQFTLSLFMPIFSSMFLHGGFIHIIGNMLYFWIFGNNIEDVLGHLKFLLFYLICGIGAALTHILSAPDSTLPTLGASGAIAGVLAAYLVLFPRARILTLIPIFFFIELAELPAFLIIGLWFVLQLANGVASITSLPIAAGAGGVAWFAHIGGFLTGLLLILVLPKRKKERYSDYYA